MGDEKGIEDFNLRIVKTMKSRKTRMGDGHAYILNVFYLRGDGKTMFSLVLEAAVVDMAAPLSTRCIVK